MTNEIGEISYLYPTAKDIWDAAREAYSCKENNAKIFEIKTLLHDLKQEMFLSPPISHQLLAIGNNWICLTSLNGNA